MQTLQREKSFTNVYSMIIAKSNVIVFSLFVLVCPSLPTLFSICLTASLNACPCVGRDPCVHLNVCRCGWMLLGIMCDNLFGCFHMYLSMYVVVYRCLWLCTHGHYSKGIRTSENTVEGNLPNVTPCNEMLFIFQYERLLYDCVHKCFYVHHECIWKCLKHLPTWWCDWECKKSVCETGDVGEGRWGEVRWGVKISLFRAEQISHLNGILSP